MKEEGMIFDQYSRYSAVAKVLHAVSFENTSILDIGSGPYCLLGNFLSSNQITYLDPLLKDAEDSGAHTIPLSIFDDSLPLSELKRDIVVNIDTYEHIPADKRFKFVDKCISLAHSAMLFAFPCGDTPEATEVDASVHESYKHVYGKEYSWLKEHDEYGLPSTKELREYLETKGWFVQTRRQGNPSWLKELLPKVILLHEFPEMLPFILRISDIYNKTLASFDWSEHGYRTILYASKDGTRIPDEVGISQTKISDNVWKSFMDGFYSELLAEISNQLHSIHTSKENLLAQTRLEEKLEEMVLRDQEIKRLQEVVASSSETISNMFKDIELRDKEVVRLNSLVEETSKHLLKLNREVEIRDTEIERLQSVMGLLHKGNQT
jgi:O-antigen biosynthesis protein